LSESGGVEMSPGTRQHHRLCEISQSTFPDFSIDVFYIYIVMLYEDFTEFI